MAQVDTSASEKLIGRILYELEKQGLFKLQGNTLDERTANLEKARAIVVQMMANGRT